MKIIELWKKTRFHLLTLSFRSQNTEADFQKDYYSHSIVYLRFAFLFGMIFYALYALLDYRIVENYKVFWYIRFTIVIPVILLVFLLSFSRRFHRYWQIAISISILIAGGGIILMLYWAEYPADITYYVGLLLTLFYGFILIKMRFIHATICSWILIAAYFITMHDLQIDADLKYTNSFFLISMNLGFMIGGYFLETSTRLEYYSRHLLSLERQNVDKINRNLERTVLQRTREIKDINAELLEKIENLNLTEKALRESETQIRLAFDSTKTVIWSIDFSPLKLHMSDIFFKILGYPENLIPDEFSYDLLHDSDRAGFAEIIDSLVDEKKESADLEYRLKSASGEWYWLHSWGKISEFDGSGKPLSMLGITIDIHKRKKIELELAASKDDLEKAVAERTASLQSSQHALMLMTEDVNDTSRELRDVNQRLAEVNQELESFSYSVSHDLKAPLRAIDGFSKALQEDYYELLDETGKEFLRAIQNNAQMMGSLINDLLEFSRLGRKTLKITDTDFTELFQSSFEELKQNMPHRDMFFQLPDLAVLPADASLMRLVIVNLLSNAIKFTSRRDKTIIRISYELKDSEHVFAVKDNGVGFNMAYANKLFGVFQRLHSTEEFEGYGVGLSLAKRIIVRHNGKMWADAEPDKGASFYFSLPFEKKE
ncbi:MAG: PAS domain-containing protein [Candidatus Cloacimonetes bacterium]|nr:PAS domain-containing protein [Candidatus Cloacimonadota bacterium]